MKAATPVRDFKALVAEGIPDELPPHPGSDPSASHAPARRQVLSRAEKELALRNALRYFPPHLHAALAPEFALELETDGRIYMRRYRPAEYEMHARPIDDYPARSRQAAAIMLMIQNNLDPAVAQHPDELITYGGNGTVFQNWAQYRLTMKYLAEMTDEQTLVLYSGHPLGLFPSRPDAPRVVRDQRHGDPEPLDARGLRPARGARRHLVRADDRGQLHVHRPAGDRARHRDHAAERGAEVPRRLGGGRARGARVRDLRSRRHERRPGQGGRDRGGDRGHRGGQPEGGREAARAGLGRGGRDRSRPRASRGSGARGRPASRSRSPTSATWWTSGSAS